MTPQDNLFGDEPQPVAPDAAFAQAGRAGQPVDPDAVPLAERLRPRTLDEVIGQQHLLGPGKPLRVAFESGKAHSMILWGPPGVGKTTLARLMADAFDAEFIALSAVLAGVKDIREADRAGAGHARAAGARTIVFVDEIHRFNKAQQDALLPFVESGLFTFVGATTENPSFEVNSALLSRAQVYVLSRSTTPSCAQLLEARRRPRCRALSSTRRRSTRWSATPTATRAACSTCSSTADHAARRPAPPKDRRQVRRARAGEQRAASTRAATTSTTRSRRCTSRCAAPIPDAALYWFARMLDGGADPRYLARRMVRMASEDIGLADPRALRMTLDAAETYERLGTPEGELALAQAVVYLAVAAKCNAVYKAWNAAART